MSVKVSALCWQVPLQSLEKLVLLRLADYADDDGGNIYPSIATIAHFCGMSPRAVQYILKKFMGEGLVLIVGNETGGRGRTRHYCIDLERAGQMAGPGGGHKNGGGKRVQRAQKPCTLSDPAETVQRVHEDAVKGAQALHPTLQGTVTEESVAEATGAAAPSGGTVVAFPLDDKAKLFGPVLNTLLVRMPDKEPREIRGQVAKAFHGLGAAAALDLCAMAAVKDEPWSWLCAAINARLKPKMVAGGRPMTSDDAAARDLLSDLRSSGYGHLLGDVR
jgi:hypothetical protein